MLSHLYDAHIYETTWDCQLEILHKEKNHIGLCVLVILWSALVFNVEIISVSLRFFVSYCCIVEFVSVNGNMARE